MASTSGWGRHAEGIVAEADAADREPWNNLLIQIFEMSDVNFDDGSDVGSQGDESPEVETALSPAQGEPDLPQGLDTESSKSGEALAVIDRADDGDEVAVVIRDARKANRRAILKVIAKR